MSNITNAFEDPGTRIIDATLPDGVLGSKQFSTIIDVLSEGEIEGFPSASGLTQGTSAYNNAALKDVFMNGTQVLQQNASNTTPDDSDFNFQNVTFTPRFGTSNQTYIPGIAAIETENPVGTNVTASSPVTQTISNTSVNAVRITIGFPSIQKFEDDGDIVGTSVSLTMKVIENDGTTTTALTDTITGRSKDPYFRDYKIEFASTISFPVQVRVERDTADSTESTLVDAFQWVSFTEIINEQRPYADIAHVGIRFDAEQFPQIPTRMYKIRGIKVKIPHNATVQSDGSISYSGTFNGTFKTNKEWTSDPAWILYDLLTNTRYGASLSETTIDQYAFYSASVYNSTQVDDGVGGTEPRFSCNVNINNGNEAFTLINDLCAVMRVMPFYSAGSITISQDRPADPVYQFTLANVLDGGFTYAGTSLKTRHTIVNVGYFDMETQTLDYETVEDTTASTKYGSVVKNIKSFACTSRGQAARMGRWFLYNEQQSSETCTFTTTLEAGVLVRPGQIIQISDPVRAGVRRGGKINTATTTSITVDNISDLPTTPTLGDTISAILSDGTLETGVVSDITNSVFTVNSVTRADGTTNTSFTSAPQTNSVWVYESTALQTTTWRVVNVVENDGLNYTITALTHNSGKYNFVEDGSALPTRTVTTLTELKPAPSNLVSQEQIVVLNNRAVSKLIVSWTPVQGVSQYRVQHRFNNGNFITQTVSRPDIEIFETDIGTFEFRIFSFNALGKPSTSPSTLTVNTVGKTALPEDPSGLTLEPVSDQFVRLRFNPSTSVDVLHGGTVSVRHTPSVDPAVATFQNSTEIIPRLAGNITETLVPALTGTYSIKFIDDTGNRSKNAARIIVTAPDPQPNQVILTEREDTDSPPFQGEKTNTFYDATFDGLLLDGTLLWDSITQNIDDLSNIDFAGPINSSGSYEFQNKVDMGAIFNLMLKRRFVTSGLLVNDLIDSRTALIDTWTEFDGTQADDVNAKLLVATTNIDPATSVSATYEQSGTTITITKTSHGYSAGDFVVIDFTAGSATDGNYEIQTVPNANTFTVTASASATISSGTSCTYGANFTQFNTFANGEYTARGFKFKCELESNDPAQNINVTELGFEASVKRRTETSIGNSDATNGLIASGTSSSGKTVTFTDPFFAGTGSLGGSTSAFLPTVGITLDGAVSGDYFKITSITGTQFVIEVRDINNNPKNLNFRYTAIGFGKGT